MTLAAHSEISSFILRADYGGVRSRVTAVAENTSIAPRSMYS